MFQNLRPNSQLYILHKDMTPFVETGSVASVSVPRPKYPATVPLGQFSQATMVVDVVASVGGQSTNLQGLPAGAEIADFGQGGNIVVSCSRDAINNEIALMRQKSEDILNSVDAHKAVISACEKMMSELNPEIAAKQQQEAEIVGLKAQMTEMKREFTEFMSVMKEQFGIGNGTQKNQKE